MANLTDSNTTRTDSFETTLEGYAEIAYIDLTPKTNESITNAYLDNVDLTAGSTSTGSPTYDNETFGFYCNINFNISVDFALPNFLSKPKPNLNLFIKADQFSYHISELNDTLIQLFQQMKCCHISDEYNRTVVPIFRFLASSKDHTDCGDSPNLKGESCGGNSDFMKTILGVVKNITKLYTAIEPLFCLISPIPGNPWLPIDFNWMAPIRPYIQTFEQLMDKIMSGSLFDIIIDPVKNLNRTLQNCTKNQTNRSIAILNKTSNTNIDNEILSLTKKANITMKNISSTSNINTQLTEQDGINKNINDINTKKEQDIAIWKTLANVAPIGSIPMNTSSEAFRLREIRNPGTGICRCLMNMAHLEIKLPKFPKAKIRILPINALESNNINRNDLLKYSNETAYAIKNKDIIPSLSNSTTYLKNDNITFTDSISTDLNFVEQFKRYMEKDNKSGGSSRTYYKAEDILDDLINYIDPEWINIEPSDFTKKFINNLPAMQFAYTDKAEYIKETIAEYNNVLTRNWYGTIDINIPKSTGSSTDILATNRELIAYINDMSTKENKYIEQLDKIRVQDKLNWEEAVQKAEVIIKNLNIYVSEDLITLDDSIYDYTSHNVFKQQQMYLDIFSTYLEFDINIDFYDNRLYEKLVQYFEIMGTPIYQLALEYISKRLALYYFDEITGDNYKEFAKKSITEAKDLIKNLFDYGYYLEYNTESEIFEMKNPSLSEEAQENYGKLLSEIYSKPFGNYMLEYLFNDPINKNYITKSYKGMIYVNSAYKNTMLNNAEEAIINGLPTITIAGQQYNYVYYSIKILQCEEYKLTMFAALEENVAYDFYLTYYPKIDCGCDTIVCKLIQMVIDYLMYYINLFLGWLLQLLLDWLIPKWLKALIDLIIYKLKCIMSIVYMGDTMKLIDKVYENFLNNLKTRVNNYPYENCANTALNNALQAITDQYEKENEGDGSALSITDATDELREHNISVEFVDINKRKISNCTMSQFVQVSIKVEYDIGADIQNIILSDSTILGDSSSVELVNQPSNVYDGQKIYVVDIPLETILSGKLKVLVKSYKSFADEPIKYDTDELILLDFIDSSKMRFILSDYQTSDYKIFLEKNKETLNVSFNILQRDEYGDPTQNLFLIKNYIDSIVLFDKAPEGTISLPGIILKDDDLVNDTHYSEESGLFTIIVNCNNFFPISRNIYGVINTKSIYDGIALNVQDDIYCQAEDSSMDSNTTTYENTTATFNDTIIYSKIVTVPNTLNQTEQDILDHTIQVRQSTPLVFDCTLSIGAGTSANIVKLNNELHDIWLELGMI